MWLLIFALILIVLGWMTLQRGRTIQADTGIPVGRVIYADSDMAQWQENSTPFYSKTHHLTGKPDYLVQTADGIIPVEVKSANAPDVPYFGHILQLAAYCLLVEESTGQPPTHGLLKYADALFEVDFTPELREELLATMKQMRAGHEARAVRRSHQQPSRCRACGFYDRCEEAL